MNPLSRIRIRTGIGRPLDFRYRSNRFVVFAALLAWLGTLAWRWSTGSDDLLVWPVRVAAGVFLTWAISRELDPDDNSPAALAPLIVLPFMALGPPSLSAGFAVLIGIRIAVRTTGRSPHWIDGVMLTVAAAYLGTQPEAWPALVVLILALGTDRFADPSGPARTLWFSGAVTSGAVIGAMAFPSPYVWRQPTRPEWAILGVTFVAALFAIVKTRPPHSRGDIHDEMLSRSRLRLGRTLALVALMAGGIELGGPVVPTLTPLWAASIAVAIVHVRPGSQRDRAR